MKLNCTVEQALNLTKTVMGFYRANTELDSGSLSSYYSPDSNL